MLQNILLKAGEWNSIAKQGKFINVVLAAGDISARITLLNNTTFETKLVSGMAFPIPDGFQSVAFKSDIAQQTKIWLGDLPLTYSSSESKVVGASAIESSTGKAYYNEVTELLKAESGRGKVTIYAKEDLYIGGVGVTDASAVRIASGDLFEIATQGAIYAYSKESVNKRENIAKLDPASAVTTSGYSHSFGTNKVHNLNDYFFHGETSLSVLNGTTNANTNLTHPDLASSSSFVAGRVVRGDKLYALGRNGNSRYLVCVDMNTLAVTSELIAVVACSPVYFAFDGVNTAWSCTNGDVYINGILVEANVTGYTSVFFTSDGTLVAMGALGSSYSTDLVSFTAQSLYSVYGASVDNATRTVAMDPLTGAFYLFAVDTIFKSVNYGETWVGAYQTTRGIYSILALGDVVYAATHEDLQIFNFDGLGERVVIPYAASSQVSMNTMAMDGNGTVYCSAGSGITQQIKGESVGVGGLDVPLLTEVN